MQLPVPPDVVHGVAGVKRARPESIVKLIVRPVRRVHEAAAPLFTLTCAVNMCVAPTGFVAVGGVIWMFASTFTNGTVTSPGRRAGAADERRGRCS